MLRKFFILITFFMCTLLTVGCGENGQMYQNSEVSEETVVEKDSSTEEQPEVKTDYSEVCKSGFELHYFIPVCISPGTAKQKQLWLTCRQIMVAQFIEGTLFELCPPTRTTQSCQTAYSK